MPTCASVPQGTRQFPAGSGKTPTASFSRTRPSAVYDGNRSTPHACPSRHFRSHHDTGAHRAFTELDRHRQHSCPGPPATRRGRGCITPHEQRATGYPVVTADPGPALCQSSSIAERRRADRFVATARCEDDPERNGLVPSPRATRDPPPMTSPAWMPCIALSPGTGIDGQRRPTPRRFRLTASEKTIRGCHTSRNRERCQS